MAAIQRETATQNDSSKHIILLDVSCTPIHKRTNRGAFHLLWLNDSRAVSSLFFLIFILLLLCICRIVMMTIIQLSNCRVHVTLPLPVGYCSTLTTLTMNDLMHIDITYSKSSATPLSLPFFCLSRVSTIQF